MIINSRLRFNEQIWVVGFERLREIANYDFKSNHKSVTKVKGGQLVEKEDLTVSKKEVCP